MAPRTPSVTPASSSPIPVVFGIGAAVNGGCAISTLTRLGSGEAGMLATLAGFWLGLAAPMLAAPPLPWAEALLAVLWIWGLWELAILWRTRPAGAGWRGLASVGRWRLSTAAAVIGIANGLLCARHGAWAYTAILGDSAGWLLAAGPAPSAVRGSLFAAMLAGIGASVFQRRSFRWRGRPSAAWLRFLAGGTLMGLGAVAIPGGNDALVLHAFPALSPHAPLVFAAMAGGIALSLAAARLAGGGSPIVECRGDVCSS